MNTRIPPKYKLQTPFQAKHLQLQSVLQHSKSSRIRLLLHISNSFLQMLISKGQNSLAYFSNDALLKYSFYLWLLCNPRTEVQDEQLSIGSNTSAKLIYEVQPSNSV